MLTPLADRIVVKPTAAEEITKGGIVLPVTAKERPLEGIVIAAGPGKILDKGTIAPMEVKVGDTVIYAKYGGTEVKVTGETYVMLRQDDILAIVE